MIWFDYPIHFENPYRGNLSRGPYLMSLRLCPCVFLLPLSSPDSIPSFPSTNTSDESPQEALSIQSTSWTPALPVSYNQSLRSSVPTHSPSILVRTLQYFGPVHVFSRPLIDILRRSLANI
ncbi:hypothetical protein JAAARDRAFT_501397 [Jaapia argillacea MUCL 33604]|uniref:Uncharacterized protein n=1 Tax=Jaapia argillacea MUCL 33604 TaxID=933084 RepID=A0A067PMV8_9AGAM|nr:hypothetical protein JAAARDRAFT_501397 [Jaapia argillacea MUCL 33604]